MGGEKEETNPFPSYLHLLDAKTTCPCVLGWGGGLRYCRAWVLRRVCALVVLLVIVLKISKTYLKSEYLHFGSLFKNIYICLLIRTLFGCFFLNFMFLFLFFLVFNILCVF